MRLHQLRIEAFGPFAGEVSIDLDALSEAGLFLLTGPTGAGKTSVLDAICFALYGAVPGDRQTAKRLRCDQAAPGVAPAVTLEFTVSGRRFRIERSAGWQRPKKRGTGLTTEQPRVLVCERVDGEWQSLASRLDDAGHLVTGLLGMNLTQFCQVQLLPQGQFQAFLRADSHERHQLLQQLFRTTRFEQVETWLRERRRALGRESVRHHEAVAELVSRVSEASGQCLPDDWDLHALAPVADALAPWAAHLHADAAAAAAEAEAVVAGAVSAHDESRSRLEAGRVLAERQQRLDRARTEHAALLADAPGHAEQVRRLDTARRAAGVLPLAEVADRAEVEAQTAAAEATATLAHAEALLERRQLTITELHAHQREAADEAARTRALAPRVTERDRLADQLVAATARLTELTHALAAADQRLADLPAAVAARRTAQAEARRAADALDAARGRVDSAHESLAAGRRVAELVARRTQAQDLLREAVDETHRVAAHWLELQELRLTGMAAEIAVGLAVGADCPVCGSAEHPRPAEPRSDAPDAEAIRVARSVVDDAEVVRLARAGAVTDLEVQISRARERAGQLTVPVLERELADVQARLGRLTARAAELPTQTQAVESLERELADLGVRRGRLDAEHAVLEANLVEWGARISRIEADVVELLGDSGATSVADRARHLDDVAQACGAAAAAVRERDRRGLVATEARSRADSRAQEQGFEGVADAVTATLTPAELEGLESQVRAYDHRGATIDTLLADPDLVTAAESTPPDLDALAARDAAAQEDLVRARDEAATCRRRTERLTRLTADLIDALTRWRPVREQHELADRLASLVDGTSADNRWRMRLSGYVLAFRLRQVVNAANERLVSMSDGRYRLEHSGDRGAGESRGGLSLRIRDDWTGETRDPVTLSGGETFVVSLALALGLADVIAHEAGGAELATLFVDEGFGTLDADTLDDVMDTLDSLRDGGRVVGVVSHVAELKMRIPTQLRVCKHRSGSTVHQDSPG